jgi:hypothetical protein
MAIDRFIPVIWTAKLFQELDKAHVFVNVCNRDYEGEITAFGDSVKINAIGDVTINDYTKNSTTITPQELDDAQTILTIDKAKYFAFKIDDIDKAQTKPKVMAEAMRKSAYGLRDASDQTVAGLFTDAGNHLGGPGTPVAATTSALAIHHIGLLGQKLDENDVPAEGRWVVVPPWFVQKLVLAEILQTDGSVSADSAFRNGWSGSCMGFNVYMSNNVTRASTWAAATPAHEIMAGSARAMSFAQQILSMEAYRPDNAFADAVKGLYVYGAKVVDPNALVRFTATYAAG